MTEFRKGDRVAWSSHGGEAEGVVEKKITQDGIFYRTYPGAGGLTSGAERRARRSVRMGAWSPSRTCGLWP